MNTTPHSACLRPTATGPGVDTVLGRHPDRSAGPEPTPPTGP
ncbi:hypothetical protein [Streptomyces sp. ISL-36]|nr:hypothetical protein [Streptomyces sp. ISL-36]